MNKIGAGKFQILSNECGDLKLTSEFCNVIRPLSTAIFQKVLRISKNAVGKIYVQQHALSNSYKKFQIGQRFL